MTTNDESIEVQFSNGIRDYKVESYAEAVTKLLNTLGSEIVFCDSWDDLMADEDGHVTRRQLVWRNESDADNDPGVNAVASIVRRPVRRSN